MILQIDLNNLKQREKRQFIIVITDKKIYTCKIAFTLDIFIN